MAARRTELHRRAEERVRDRGAARGDDHLEKGMSIATAQTKDAAEPAFAMRDEKPAGVSCMWLTRGGPNVSEDASDGACAWTLDRPGAVRRDEQWGERHRDTARCHVAPLCDRALERSQIRGGAFRVPPRRDRQHAEGRARERRGRSSPPLREVEADDVRGPRQPARFDLLRELRHDVEAARLRGRGQRERECYLNRVRVAHQCPMLARRSFRCVLAASIRSLVVRVSAREGT